MISRKSRSRRESRRSDPSFPDPRPPIGAELTIVSDKLRITTTAPVMVVGTPSVRWAGNLPTAVTIVSPTVIDLTFPDAVGAGGPLSLSANDRAIRTRYGGFIESFELTLG